MSERTTTTSVPASPPTFYEAFHGQGILYDTLPCTAVHIILEIIGLFGNTAIIIATITSKQLHGTCNTLLSIGAAGDILHQFSHYYMGYLMFSGKTFTDLRTCVYVNVIPLIGLSVGLFMILFIAIDRLFSVLLPGKHRILNKTLYIGVYLLIITGYCAFVLMMVFFGMEQTPEFQTTCLITDAMPGGIGQTWFTICLIVNAFTMVCYITVWLTLKYKTNTSESTRRMFKSLAAITLMVFLGWAINACIQVALRAFHATPVTYWYTGFYAGIPVNIACSCNYFVLYAFSKDYRLTFQQQLNTVTQLICKRNYFNDNAGASTKTITVAWTSAVS